MNKPQIKFVKELNLFSVNSFLKDKHGIDSESVWDILSDWYNLHSDMTFDFSLDDHGHELIDLFCDLVKLEWPELAVDERVNFSVSW